MSYQRARDDLKFLNEINTLFADNFVDVYTKPLNYCSCFVVCFDLENLGKVTDLSAKNDFTVEKTSTFFPITLIIRNEK